MSDLLAVGDVVSPVKERFEFAAKAKFGDSPKHWYARPIRSVVIATVELDCGLQRVALDAGEEDGVYVTTNDMLRKVGSKSTLPRSSKRKMRAIDATLRTSETPESPPPSSETDAGTSEA